MEQRLVSIITPMYNAEKTIAQTIESVLLQTYSNWEMIIMDDCSTDKSAKIVEEYLKKDFRIQYYRAEKNSGVANAREDAISRAKGHYLAFLDSDDLWKKDKLRRQIELMQKENIPFCYSAYEVIDKKGKIIKKKRKVPVVADYKKLLKGNFIPCLTVVVEREVLLNRNIPKISHEDYAMWLMILKTGIKAYGINEVLASYRINRKSISANKWKSAKWTWTIYYRQEKLPLFRCLFYFANYALYAIKKRII